MTATLSLVLGTCATASARQNLATFRYKTLQALEILVVHIGDVINTENTNLAAATEFAALISSFAIIVCHDIPLGAMLQEQLQLRRPDGVHFASTCNAEWIR